MMQYIFTFVFLIIFTSIYAQDINGGFEKWTPSGQPAPFNWESPTGWGTSNPRTEFISAGVKKTNIRKSGNWAAELSTLNIFGNLAPAVLSLGRLKIDFIEGKYVDDIFAGGINLDNKPAAIKFWYRYTSPELNDRGFVRTFVKRYDATSGTSSIVYEDSLDLSIIGPFTETTLPISFGDFNTQTDTMGIIFMSGKANEVKGMSQLYVDGLEIVYISSTSNEYQNDRLVYPNPVVDGNTFFIKGLDSELISKVNLFTMDGKQVSYSYHQIDQDTVLFTLNNDVKGLIIIKINNDTYFHKIIMK